MNNEPENLSRNDEKTRQILGSLEKIDAPKDFNFQLKSKIANTKATRKNQVFWRYFAVAVPSLACVLLAAFFVFNRNVQQPATVAEVKEPQKIQTPTIVEIPIIKDLKPTKDSNTENAENLPDKDQNPQKSLPIIEPKIVDEKIYAKVEKQPDIKPESVKLAPKKPKAKDDFIGVKTEAGTDIEKPLQPKGLNASSANTTINQTDTVFEIENLLDDLGVEAIAENGKLKVKSVKKNSLAERSGVKTDDVIDAVDNQKIAPKEIRKKAFDAKSISITREGKTIELKLQQ
jgi:hypothetical protein